MSTYSRTRKAICRGSHLSEWIVSRSEFRRQKIKTWKESYKDFRKNIFGLAGCIVSTHILRVSTANCTNCRVNTPMPKNYS